MNATESTSGRDALEEYLLLMWRQALRLDDVGPDDDFFELGGDSLAAMQIAAQIAARFRLEVSTVMAFDQPTIRELAQAIEKALDERAADLSEEEAVARLTTAGQRPAGRQDS